MVLQAFGVYWSNTFIRLNKTDSYYKLRTIYTPWPRPRSERYSRYYRYCRYHYYLQYPGGDVGKPLEHDDWFVLGEVGQQEDQDKDG